MKKYFTLIVLSLTLVLSCEKDDICLENTTPNLILKFYDFEKDTIVKKVLIDSIKAIDNAIIEGYTKKTLDSILIPLGFIIIAIYHHFNHIH